MAEQKTHDASKDADVLEVRQTNEEPNTIKENTCRHFWRISSANGAHSLGICKFCGEEKEFTNGNTINSNGKQSPGLVLGKGH